MKLALKLPLAFAATLLFVVAAALFGIHSLNRSILTFETEVQRSHQQAAAASHLLSQFKTQVQEWKNTLLRGQDPKQLDRYWTAFNKIEKEMAAGSTQLAAELPAGPAQDLVKQFAAAHATMGNNYRAAFATFTAAGHDHTVGDKAVSGMDREPARLLDAAVKQLADDSAALAGAAQAQAQRATTISLVLMAVVCGVGVVGGVLFSLWKTRGDGGPSSIPNPPPTAATMSMPRCCARETASASSLLSGPTRLIVVTATPCWASQPSARAMAQAKYTLGESKRELLDIALLSLVVAGEFLQF